jgi:V-type H+-transporting ATPase subunit a
MIISIQVSARDADPELMVPTYNKSTDFADVSQMIVDTYGVPAYKEANPAVFTGVTFPFLFAIMYGDIMHGSMVLAAAIVVLIMGEKAVGSNLWSGRWMLLLMGIFATFCGFIYNDFGSVPIYTFPSCYTYYRGNTDPTETPGCVYPAGVDPAWYLSS